MEELSPGKANMGGRKNIKKVVEDDKGLRKIDNPR